MTHTDFGLINKWLRNIKDVYEKHEGEIDAVTDPVKRFDLMVELNVREQVKNLQKTTIVQRAWKNFGSPHLHGWVFDLKTGLIHEILDLPPGSPIEGIFRYDFPEAEE